MGTAPFARVDDVEKPFRDVRICPTPNVGQVFVTGKSGTTLNIVTRTQGRLCPRPGGAAGLEDICILTDAARAATCTRDLSGEESGFAVPLHFATALTGAFTAGVRFAHRWAGRTGDGGGNEAGSLLCVVIIGSLELDGTLRTN